MTIIGFIGQRGSGKTLSMTIEGYKKYLQGYKIYSNYHLNFPHTLVTVDDLMSIAESGEYTQGVCYLLDELHIFFDSRLSGKKRSIVFSYFINQSSKTNSDILYTTQFARQVEIRLRLNTELVVESVCRTFVWKHKHTTKPIMIENYRPRPDDFKCISYITNSIIKFSDTGNDKIVKRVYNGKKYYCLYDTKQVIKMQTDLFERNKTQEKERKKLLKKEEQLIQDVIEQSNKGEFDADKLDYKHKRALQRLNGEMIRQSYKNKEVYNC